MKKILISIIIVGLVSMAVGYGTTAYFSDTEMADAELQAGNDDISVDGQNPWNQTYALTDLKPGKIRWMNVTVENVGDPGNPVKLYKSINVTAESGGLHPEPEKAADPGDTRNDVSTAVDYHLSYRVYDDGGILQSTGAVHTWGDNVTLADVNSTSVQLVNSSDPLKSGWTVEVHQGYRMLEDAGNEYQGDNATFDVEFYATQPNGNGPDG